MSAPTERQTLRDYMLAHCLVCGEKVEYEEGDEQPDPDPADPLSWPVHWSCSGSEQSEIDWWESAGAWAIRALEAEAEVRFLRQEWALQYGSSGPMYGVAMSEKSESNKSVCGSAVKEGQKNGKNREYRGL